MLFAVFLPLATGRVREPQLLALLVASGIALASPGALLAAGVLRSRRLERAWRVLSGALGVVLILVYLSVTVEVPFVVGQLIFVALLIANAFLSPRRWRLPLALWAAAGAVVLAASFETRDPATLSSYGILLLGLVILVLQVRDQIDRRNGQAAAAAELARKHTELLATLQVTRVEHLDAAEELLDRVLAGLGFDLAVVLEQQQPQALVIVHVAGSLPAGLLGAQVVATSDDCALLTGPRHRLLSGPAVAQLFGRVPTDHAHGERLAVLSGPPETALVVRLRDNGHPSPALVVAGSRSKWNPEIDVAVAAGVVDAFGGAGLQTPRVAA